MQSLMMRRSGGSVKEGPWEPRSGCAINAAVEALGDHWSFLVLRDVIFGDRRYFRELLNGSIEGIASNILSDRLKKLLAAGILTKDEAARGQRARYSLTEAGIQTLPIIFALGNWGLDWRTGTPELRTRQELMRAEGLALHRGTHGRAARASPRGHTTQAGRPRHPRTTRSRISGRGWWKCGTGGTGELGMASLSPVLQRIGMPQRVW